MESSASTSQDYATEFRYFEGFAISMLLCLLLWELYIYLRLWYGKYQVNKLTFKPMIWALLAILTMLLYFGSFAIYSRQWTSADFQDYKKMMSDPFVIYVLYPLLNLNNYFQMGFLSSIFFEQHVLLIFIVF